MSGVSEEIQKNVPELTEDLVERIIARMPFPSLFQAASLSKTWHSHFAGSSSEARSSSLFFQEQVASVSRRWPVYCPIYHAAKGIGGFDRGSNQWRSVITLSHCPQFTLVKAAGPLLFGFRDRYCVFGDISVLNVLTRKWRTLPKPAHLSLLHGGVVSPEDHIAIFPLKVDGYKVLLVHNNSNRGRYDTSEVRVQIYDSRLTAWTAKEPCMVGFGRFNFQSAFVGEKLYMLCESSDFFQVWVYDVPENLWTAVCPTFTRRSHASGAVLRCAEKVFLALSKKGVAESSESIVIYELLFDPLRLEHLDTSPQNLENGEIDLDYYCLFYSSDAEFIYFGTALESSHVLTFNVTTKEWGSLPPTPKALGSGHQENIWGRGIWGNGGFEPSLNPLMAV